VVRLDFEFVRGIERRHRDVDDAQVADCAVDAPRGDHDGGEGFQRIGLSVCFEDAFTLEHDVDLRHALVVVGAAVLGNIGEVNRGESVVRIVEGAPCLAAGAGNGRNGVKLGDANGWLLASRRGKSHGMRARLIFLAERVLFLIWPEWLKGKGLAMGALI